MATRSGLLNNVLDVLSLYKAGTLQPVETRRQLGYLARRLTSYTTTVSGVVFQTYWSNSAAMAHPAGNGTEVDHAVPIACIVEDMMYEAVKPGGNPSVAKMSMEYGFHLVRVTEAEHKSLSRSSMPAGWQVDKPLSWKARYIAAKIQVDWIERNGKLEPI